MMEKLLLLLALHVHVTGVLVAAADLSSPFRSRLLTPIVVGVRSATRSYHPKSSAAKFNNAHMTNAIIRGGASSSSSDVEAPPKLLKWAYTAGGVATSAAWSTMVYTTIRSNQPMGAMMPSPQHGLFARIVSS